MVTLDEVKQSPIVQQYMDIGNKYIGTIGAIEHNVKHAELVAFLCYDILKTLGYSQRVAELGAIAGYLHDIGNLINRYGHGLSGSIIAFKILFNMKMKPDEISTIIGAIGNHEEHANGNPVNPVAAALILADKSHVHNSRVRKRETSLFTPRDRVNYAVSSSKILIDPIERVISLKMDIDTDVCSVMEYFEIFLTKMLMSRRAAEHLECEFELIINDSRLL
ncbi:hypothetical protein SYNTR_0220 [Candidatus Syntrophocurvum alkaliphilum]|uniref:HD/PDEase domain-containing protein n=1 Tax=Candidatus Syntrophocurvum alkaliphilum TaxID=2293317 RepID=A0A6I6D6D6_9FIRM|nr:HD domain-containing protein [Candidatus Syntrophocurvum alkaliphilum]QGT98813.1 hypothetical protein SYNTR_0220 [Candidatus Syntrophocurvum alkaliphilum]